MSMRTRMLLAFGVVVLIPLALLAFGLRQEMTRRLSEEYQTRVDTVVEFIREDLQRESSGISERLASLKNALLNDNRFRLAAVASLDSEREYLLNYAGDAMRLTGLSMLQVQDGDGRIISSGHFRNEHGRLEPGLSNALLHSSDDFGGRGAFFEARTPEGEFLVMARSEEFRISGQPFTLVGGVTVDQSFLARLARDPTITVKLLYPEGELSSDPDAESDPSVEEPGDTAVGTLAIPLIRTEPETSLAVVEAQLQVTQPLTPLRALLDSVDSWFLLIALGTGATALVLALWLSSRISRPLAALAAKTAVLDLDRLDVRFESGTDEVGSLARLLSDLASRLRMSTARVREAERRATVGDLARQINHDIKNGLIPLRNVMRHLEQVEENEPAALRSVFAERRSTIDSSIEYLQTLATTYQRLSPSPDTHTCDVNALIKDVVRAAERNDRVEFTTQLHTSLPPVVGDPIALRRILENLIANAAESLSSESGRVSLSTEVVERDGELPSVRITVTDTGRGMSKEETDRIFADFYTTKEGGTGLGLSIVRRLVMDLRGEISVLSDPGQGTRVIIEIPSKGWVLK